MRKLVVLLASLSLAAFSVSMRLPQKENGPGLTQSQIKKLRMVGRVIVATFLPQGFKVSKVAVDAGEYEIDYAGPHGATLMVQMASDGIGDIALDSDDPHAVTGTKTVHNSAFGTLRMDTLIAPGELQFAVNWVDLGAHSKPEFLSIIGDHLSPAIGAKVWQGLRELKR